MSAALAAQGLPDFAVAFMLSLFTVMRAGQNTPVSDHVREVLGREARAFSAFAQDAAASFSP